MNDTCGMPSAQIADYYTGQADVTSTREIEAHIVGCASCQELLRTMALLSGATPEEINPNPGDHPTLGELTRYYKEPGSPDAGRIADHIARCEDCGSEIRFLGEVELKLAQSLSPDRRPGASE